MTLAITPDDRVRAAAISSRPTWAMNLTAGSAAAAGRGAPVNQMTHAIVKMHAETAAAARPECRLDLAGGRVPMIVDMLCLTPLLPVSTQGGPRPIALELKRHAARL